MVMHIALHCRLNIEQTDQKRHTYIAFNPVLLICTIFFNV